MDYHLNAKTKKIILYWCEEQQQTVMTLTTATTATISTTATPATTPSTTVKTSYCCYFTIDRQIDKIHKTSFKAFVKKCHSCYIVCIVSLNRYPLKQMITYCKNHKRVILLQIITFNKPSKLQKSYKLSKKGFVNFDPVSIL